MLKAVEVERTSQEVKRLFDEDCHIHVAVKNGKPSYEIIIFAPHCPNIGRGSSLPAALMHLKTLNHK